MGVARDERDAIAVRERPVLLPTRLPPMLNVPLSRSRNVGMHALLVALALGIPAPRRVEAQDVPPVMQITMQRLRPTMHVASGYANGNVLIVESDTGLLLVDAQTAKRVAELDSAIRMVSARPVRLVIDTHYHGDHVEGNAHFRSQGAQVLAHRTVPVQAEKDTVIADWGNWHRTSLAVDALPTRAFDDSVSFDFGRERVVVLHAPSAHTDGDAMIWFPRSNVLHIGDIFEVGAPPFIDLWSGGSLAGMLGAIDRVMAMVNDQTSIVPGHGPVSSRADLARYREMLQTVGDRVRTAAARGASADEVVAASPAQEWEASMGGPRRAQQLVRLIYADAARARR
ncbi:MAG: MBL fold metallo-hydrolase [Gemmatimonadota bacterium]